MKRTTLKSILLVTLIIGFSCDEPETTVTDIVHRDGSITRKIEMRNKENKFQPSDLQVPFDSTWIVKDSIVVGEKKDTTWIKTAEKFFRNADEINKSYLADKGAYKETMRKTRFVKKFKWFNTEYRFSELIDKRLANSHSIRDFLNPEELNFFYSPEKIIFEKLQSADSVKYRIMGDSIKRKSEQWLARNFISEWIFEFSKLTQARAGFDLSANSLKAREDEFYRIVSKYGNKFDSLWQKGIILKEMIGEENALKFKTEADSSLKLAENILFINLKDYTVRIIMPGKVIATNGFIDKAEALLWPVKYDYFMADPYEMWAESKVINKWAWIVTGAFILFVATGLMIRVFRKK